MIEIDLQWLNLLIGTLLPILVALVTKQHASPRAKALTLLFLSVLGGALTGIRDNGGSFELDVTLVNFAVTYITAVATYYGLWKPTAVAGSGGAAAKVAPGVGVG